MYFAVYFQLRLPVIDDNTRRTVPLGVCQLSAVIFRFSDVIGSQRSCYFFIFNVSPTYTGMAKSRRIISSNITISRRVCLALFFRICNTSLSVNYLSAFILLMLLLVVVVVVV